MSLKFFENKHRYVPHSCPNHAALCCIKLLKLCCEEARNCLKGQGLKKEYCTTLRHPAVSLPNLAFVSSRGGSSSLLHWRQPVPLQKQPGFPRPSPGRPSLRPRFPWKGSHAGWGPGAPIVLQGRPSHPGATPHSGPSSQADRRSAGLHATPSPAAPLSASPRPGGHVRLQPPEQGERGAAAAWTPPGTAARPRRRGRGPGAHGRVGTLRAAAVASRVPRPVPGWPGTERGVGRAGARWGWRARGAAVGVGRGGVGRCLSPDKGERVGHAEPARPGPPHPEGSGRGSVGGEGAGLSFTPGPSAAAGAEGRGLAPSRAMRSEGGGEWGRSPRARVPRRRLRRHVSAGERKRGADSAGTGGPGRENERGRERVSQRAARRGRAATCAGAVANGSASGGRRKQGADEEGPREEG